MKDVQGEKTYYVRDASGNVVSTYSESAGLAIQFDLPVYGSTKLGTAIKDAQGENILNYLYELSDHLGNVRAVIQDGYSGSGQTYSYADYYPGGFVMSDRQKVAPNPYRFGYQGEFAEKDPETGFNQFEARLYDSRIGRWMVPDPAGQYWSPYNGMGNNPINGVDPDGAWWFTDNSGGQVWKTGFWANARALLSSNYSLNSATFNNPDGSSFKVRGDVYFLEGGQPIYHPGD
jgi:RHS repeat-associated protein